MTAVYDAHADWYEEYVTATAAEHYARVTGLVSSLLGPGLGICLDVGCGTGVHAEQLRRLGWTPVGVDLSTGQLRHAAGRLPVAVADAAALPVATGSVPAAISVYTHSDLPDYPATLREVARVLRPGGRFVHVGLHPCFVGSFADRADPDRLILTDGYAETALRFDSGSPNGVRVRVGAYHLPLDALVNAVLNAGLSLTSVRESSPTRGYPDLLCLVALKA